MTEAEIEDAALDYFRALGYHALTGPESAPHAAHPSAAMGSFSAGLGALRPLEDHRRPRRRHQPAGPRVLIPGGSLPNLVPA